MSLVPLVLPFRGGQFRCDTRTCRSEFRRLSWDLWVLTAQRSFALNYKSSEEEKVNVDFSAVIIGQTGFFFIFFRHGTFCRPAQHKKLGTPLELFIFEPIWGLRIIAACMPVWSYIHKFHPCTITHSEVSFMCYYPSQVEMAPSSTTSTSTSHLRSMVLWFPP